MELIICIIVGIIIGIVFGRRVFRSDVVGSLRVDESCLLYTSDAADE